MKFIFNFFFLLIIFACSNRKEISLDQYAVLSYDATDDFSKDRKQEKCDTLESKDFSKHPFLCVVTKDSTPIWISPTLENKAGILHFGDTIRIHANLLSTCNPKQYVYKYFDQKDNKSYWVAGNAVVDLYTRSFGVASVYFQAAQNIGYRDTVSSKHFIELIHKKFPNDSIQFVVDDWDTISYSADEALLRLKAHQYGYWGQHVRQLEKQMELLALITYKNQKNNIALEIVYNINNLLTSNTSQDNVLECLRFLTTAITEFKNEIVYFEEEGGNEWIDLSASNIITRHYKKLASVSSESFILNLLEHSSNEAVALKAAQLKATLAIQKSDYNSARQVLLAFWKKYPAVTRNFYIDTEQASLFPTAIAFDSLISITHDYNKALSFLHDMQKGLTKKDSLLNDFLNAKATQLLFESDYPIDSSNLYPENYSFYDYPGTLGHFVHNYYTIPEWIKSSKLIRNKVIVKSGAQLFDGLNGKNISVTTNDIVGKILYETMTPNGSQSVKIQTNGKIFWTTKSMISFVPEELLLSTSKENKPFLSQLIPLPHHHKHELMDINNDDIADLFSYGSTESILDGATMQTLWKTPYPNSASIYRKDHFYTISGNQLTKYSNNTTTVWTLVNSIPGNYGSIVPFLTNYDQSLYLFTTSGYLFEINDSNGEVKNTFRFDKSLSLYPVSDGTNLFFISNDYTSESLTLHCLNLKTRTFKWQIPLDPKDQNGMAMADKDRLFISKKNVIHTLDKKTGKTIGTYIFKSDVRQFFSTDKQIIALTQQNYLESINIRDTTSSKFKWVLSQRDIQSKPLLKDSVIYICTLNELLFISAENGQIIQKILLPTRVNSLGELTIQKNRLLIPGERYLMIIENIDIIESPK